MCKNKTKKKIDNNYIKMLGESSEAVTGSQFLVQWAGYKILLECGFYQSNCVEKDYMVNASNFNFKAKEIDFVFLLHNHCDHVGKTPKLYKDGYAGKILMPVKSKPITKIMLEDSAHIIEKDRTFLNKRYKKKLNPIYTTEDVDRTINNIVEYDLEVEHKINDNISFIMYPSQHVLGSAQLLLILTQGGKRKKILYTSDLGNTKFGHTPYASDFAPVKNANIVLGESTYGSSKKSCRSKKDRDKDIEKIKSAVNQFVIDNKAKLLIPAFSFHRTQIMLKYIYDLYQDHPEDFDVVIDSPMAIKVTKEFSNLLEGQEKIEFDKMMSWKKLKFVDDWEASEMCAKSDKPMVIISASGMMSAGRVVNHTAHIIEDEKSAIMICGYASPNTMAGVIREGKKKYIKIGEETYKNKAQLIQLRTMSSHMQHGELLKYYSGINYDSLYLVHGNGDRAEFRDEIEEKLRSKNKTSSVFLGEKDLIIEL